MQIYVTQNTSNCIEGNGDYTEDYERVLEKMDNVVVQSGKPSNKNISCS